MASLRQRSNGIWEIQFRDEYRKKKTITLSGSKYTERTARKFQDAVKVLVGKKINDDPTPHKPTNVWVESATFEIRQKLAKFGLWVLPSTYTTQELWNGFLNAQKDMNEDTMKTYVYAKDRFFSFFKSNELLDALNKDRMLEWRQYLLNEGQYATATVAGTISKAKAVFNWAKKQHWLEKSPLDGVGRGSYRNKEKDRFVTQEEYLKLLEACNCQEWRTIITLARIGGLHPCEILVLRWADIYWEKDRFRASNSKLKQYENLYQREVPLFQDVAVELNTLRSQFNNPVHEFVINSYPNRYKTNLGTQFTRIAKRAGIGKIPRPFDNMRASRSTEIYNEYGAKKESLWIGHSVKVALENYLLVTDEDYSLAAKKTKDTSEVINAKTGFTPKNIGIQGE